MTNSLAGWKRDALLAFAGAGAFGLLYQTAHTFWFLPAGARFATLLLLPLRSWPWFYIAREIVFFADPHTRVSFTESVAGREAFAFVLFAAAAIGPAWLRAVHWLTRPITFAAMAQLVVMMALCAATATLANQYAYEFAEVSQMSITRMRLQLLLGDYIGILVLVPLAVMIARDRPNSAILRLWRFDVPVVLLPILALYATLVSMAHETQVFFYAALLCFVPGLYFAVRSGWRGAAIALTTSSLTVASSGAIVGNADLTVEAQGFLAVAGSACLLLGAACDTLREQRRELQERNAGLLAANAKQEGLAADLRDAARRNLDTAEQTRRWITSELHDEIGQNLTALQTRVRLLERQSGSTGGDLVGEIEETLIHMRKAVSGLMSSLRPAGLDDFGLAHSLNEGAIRKLVEDNGCIYDIFIGGAEGDLDRLDANTQTVLYRIVQEAATNTIRHAGATRLCVRLRARAVAGDCRILLVVTDDGSGLPTEPQATGIGLQGIRDRVLALGGRVRLRSGAFGTRMYVRTILPAAGRTHSVRT